MKPIKITADNSASLAVALAAVNGRADSHAYTTGEELQRVAEFAEQTLAQLGLQKGARRGARFTRTSGGTVAKAYKYVRAATCVTLERRAAEWFLVAVAAVQIRETAPKDRLQITAAQDAQIIANIRRAYSIGSRP